MQQFRFHQILLLILLLIITTGCSSSQVRVNLSSTANLNLNEDNEPLPVMINIYQLSDSKAFEETSFSELWKKDLLTLGDSLLTKKSLTINPASQEQLVFERHPQTRYVGVMAIFRQPKKEAWRSIKPVADGFFKKRFSSKLIVNLKGNTIEIVD